MRSARENIAPNPLVQGLKHLASLDGASAWWFAKVNWTTNPIRYLFPTFPHQVLIGNFTDGSGMGCTEDAIMAGFVLCVITLAIRFLMLSIYHSYILITFATRLHTYHPYDPFDIYGIHIIHMTTITSNLYQKYLLSQFPLPSGCSMDLSSLEWSSTVASRNHENNSTHTFVLSYLKTRIF